MLYPTELLAQIDKVGAGDGNRTRIPSLEGWCPSHCATPACPPKIVSSHIISYDLVSVKEKIRKVVKKSKDFFAKIAVAQRGDLCYSIEVDVQRYRSGHNGADSKSVCGQPHEGSNPSRCARKRQIPTGICRFQRNPPLRVGEILLCNVKYACGV